MDPCRRSAFFHLCSESSESFVQLVGECTSSISNVGFSLSSEQAEGRIVEHGKGLGSMAHAQLGKILTQGSIAPMMQTILNTPMLTNELQETFGMSRRGG